MCVCARMNGYDHLPATFPNRSHDFILTLGLGAELGKFPFDDSDEEVR